MNESIRIPRRRIGCLAGLLLCLWVAACSNVPDAKRQIPPTTPARHTAAVAAIEQIGERYQAHSAGPKAFNAAGLVYYAYHQAGTDLPHNLKNQLDTGKPIALATARPADLAFFQIGDDDGHPHKTVGLLISKHRMVIAAPSYDDQDSGVKLADLDATYWRERLLGVIRVLPRKNEVAIRQ